jgi:TonB family protein
MLVRVTMRARRNGWPRAVGASLVGHALLLVGLVGGARGRVVEASPELVVVDVTTELPSSAETVAGPAKPPVADEAVVARPLDAPQGDRDNAVPRTVGPRDALGRDRVAPAPDEGASGGAATAPATRRDRSSLQSRLADTSAAAQASRVSTSSRASSPQAARRERRTGTGDAVRTSEATRAPSAAEDERALAAANAPGAVLPPDVVGPVSGAKAAAREPLMLETVSQRPTPERGEGPLDAEQGARLFDVETRGRAADDQTRRAASNESHPGVTDFSHATVAAPVDSRQGRGPSDAPGAVPRPTNGTAPAVYGARSPQELAAEAAERTRERLYDRYRQEIQRRVQNVLVFPKVLALRLEQGEAVVTFIVRPDGALGDGPRIVKSSGFEEFDAEAVKAVLRAAPFPRRPETVGMALSMPVTFENPLVR